MAVGVVWSPSGLICVRVLTIGLDKCSPRCDLRMSGPVNTSCQVPLM